MGCTTEPEDCAGVSGGAAALDNCGVCDSNASNDCQDCSTHFTFNQSISQAAYYIQEVTIKGEPISVEDSVAAFKGEICVGSLHWDTSKCGQGVCEVVVMGDSPPLNHPVGQPYPTEGYMKPDDIPTFKIYDVSENIIYNATPNKIFPWNTISNEPFIISTLIADTTSVALCKE